MTNSTPACNAEKIDVAYVANLARIQLTAAELQTFQAQLTQIVDYVKDLEHVDVSAIEPMAHTGRIANVLRKDEERCGLDRQVVLANAPVHDNEQFLVPKII
ncbi:MAG: Asp-tRNA(Asn)/Glu-tRNA(Gln) amidotransferase subunit GatC [Kiritimatiellae bacterium]|nr:Asp-tRNA(Asn)/Glu-tRNA(Gln) amidotransferase subunit GatC [Verrucomicrobiota bacterium]MBU4286128.1 Asp-tRNA(Asn)/Glu-tRNA(Gln) amidotransferase subunit GatC [Verrucomicrobiota bacterium]MBU4366555.1 Asp-tRNA(Asn)/Glu-tRNA(Gln) amidotransferase subunit GatC [Verrucomicrobiota bacterium]MCG2659371.1 Asp-tRNA(Asn)/Glu-tRNA(Gln) amidotransferase subunit GatC [Kiritimatiellia bacterium]